MRRPTAATSKEALLHGWRSGLEERVAAQLEAEGIAFEYEGLTLTYTQPEKLRRYTPDFVITTRTGKQVIIETKGRWTREDRLRMILVREAHPDLDIRFVFTRPQQRISKTSKTTYASWCEKHLRCPWAAKTIPERWLDE